MERKWKDVERNGKKSEGRKRERLKEREKNRGRDLETQGEKNYKYKDIQVNNQIN